MKLLDIIFEGVVDLNELKKLTKNEFIQQATKKWKGKYTYDNVNYVNQKTKVLITCPLHGDFPQTPKNHLQGREGCDECYWKSRTSNTIDFIQKAQKILKNQKEDGTPKYTYDNVNYVSSNKSVLITCPLHGDFPKRPDLHLQGYGCDRCSINEKKSNPTKNTVSVWYPEKIKKIIKKYKSVPDFYHDHFNLFTAITNRHLQRQFLGHLKKDVSYKTGKAVKLNAWRNFDFDTNVVGEKESRIMEFIKIPFNPFSKDIGEQVRKFLIRSPFNLVKEMQSKNVDEEIEKPFLEKLKKIILDVASKYTYKTAFTKAEGQIEYLILTHDKKYPEDPWMPFIDKIMVPVGNLYRRMVYVFEFPIWKGETDSELKGKPTAYVGLTADEVKRRSAHRNSDSSQVYKYITKTGLQPIFYRLVKNKSGEIIKTIDLNYIDALDAQDLEKESLNMYKKLKFNTINIAEPGGLGGKFGGGLIPTDILKFEKFASSNGTDLSLLKLVPNTKKNEGDIKTRIFLYAEENDLVNKVINRIQEILHANQNVKYMVRKPTQPDCIEFYSKGVVTFIREYEKDYNNEDIKTFRSGLFGQEIMKSGQRETLDKLDKFLKKPNSFNIDELNYLSHGTWEQLKKRPDLIDGVFNKLKKILEKNNIKRIGELGKTTPGTLITISGPTYGFIKNHDKDPINDGDSWRDKLFGSDEEYRKMGDLDKNIPRIYNFINGDNSTETLKNISKDGYSYLKLFNQLNPEKNIMTMFFNKLKEIIDTNNITRFSMSTPVTKANPNYTKSLFDYWGSIAIVVVKHDQDNPSDRWREKLFPNLNESKLSLMNTLKNI